MTCSQARFPAMFIRLASRPRSSPRFHATGGIRRRPSMDRRCLRRWSCSKVRARCWKHPTSSDWAWSINLFDQPQPPVGRSAGCRGCFAGDNTRDDGGPKHPRLTRFGVARLIQDSWHLRFLPDYKKGLKAKWTLRIQQIRRVWSNVIFKSPFVDQ